VTEGADPTPAPGVSELELEDQLVLFDARTDATYILNSTAAFVWRRLRHHTPLDAVVSAIARSAPMPEHLARRDVSAIIAQWQAAGLVGSGNPGPQRVVSRAGVSARLAAPAPPDARLTTGPHEVEVRILDALFRIGVPDRAMIDAIGRVFDAFRVENPDDGSAIRLFVRATPSGWRLLEEARELARCSSRDAVIPLVHTYALMLGYLRSTGSAAVHAAAVSNGNACVLLPGASGSGKSTLTAALVCAGFSCLADDIAVLTEAPVRLRPMPVSIALKAGSWSLLTRLQAELGALPEHALTDGTRVRYFAPGATRAQARSDSPVQVNSLVFPRFVAARGSELRAIGRADAFGRLFAAGHDLKGPFSEARVRALTDWLRETPCFQLVFSDLDAAVERIASLTS
jgi:hypothetical protein